MLASLTFRTTFQPSLQLQPSCGLAGGKTCGSSWGGHVWRGRAGEFLRVQRRVRRAHFGGHRSRLRLRQRDCGAHVLRCVQLVARLVSRHASLSMRGGCARRSRRHNPHLPLCSLPLLRQRSHTWLVSATMAGSDIVVWCAARVFSHVCAAAAWRHPSACAAARASCCADGAELRAQTHRAPPQTRPLSTARGERRAAARWTLWPPVGASPLS